MNRKEMLHFAIAVLALAIGSATVSAHNGVEHVMGTMTALTNTSVTVDTAQHTAVTVLIHGATHLQQQRGALFAQRFEGRTASGD